MKFRWNRKKGKVEAINPIPDQRAKAERARSNLGIPNPAPVQTVRTAQPGATFRNIMPGQLYPVSAAQQAAMAAAIAARMQALINNGGFSGRNWNSSEAFYGCAPRAPNPRTRCDCAECTGNCPYDAWAAKRYSDIPYTGVRAGELIAWRFWRLDGKTGLLQSASMDNLWYPGLPMTGDVQTFGVFSWNDKEWALREAHRWLGAHAWCYVFGTIAHWGEVIEHAHGYRSERAEIKSLDMLVWDEYYRDRFIGQSKLPNLEKLRKLYGVEK